MAWYAIRYSDGTYKKQRSSREDKVRFTDDIKRSHKFISVQFLKNALFHDKESLKGACIVCVDTEEIVEYIRIYDKLLEGIIVLKETEKAILINTNEWIPKSQCEVFEEKIYVSDWFYSKIESKLNSIV
jgi:hypothetical protein